MVFDRWVLSGWFPITGPLNLIGMWFGEDQKENIIKTHVEKRLDHVFEY